MDHSEKIRQRFVKLVNFLVSKETDGARTVAEFGRSIGVPQSNMSAIMSGKRTPSLTMLCDTCLRFTVSPEWLFMGTGKAFKKQQQPQTEEQKKND